MKKEERGEVVSEQDTSPGEQRKDLIEPLSPALRIRAVVPSIVSLSPLSPVPPPLPAYSFYSSLSPLFSSNKPVVLIWPIVILLCVRRYVSVTEVTPK